MSESFHDAFERALCGETSALDPWWNGTDADGSGLGVYRNTTTKGLVDAIMAQFPTVTSVVGPDWMAVAARAFGSSHPPTAAPLVVYGQEFADWLDGPAREQDLPYLADLARLDRLWTECHTAADDPDLAPDALSRLDAKDFGSFRLTPRASSRWASFPWAVPTLWQALREDSALAGFDLEDRAEGLLLTRPDLDVAFSVVAPGAVAFLAACAEGLSMAAAAAAALSADPGLNLQASFAHLVAAGAFTCLGEIAT